MPVEFNVQGDVFFWLKSIDVMRVNNADVSLTLACHLFMFFYALRVVLRFKL